MEARNETLAADKLFCSLKRTRVVEDRSKDNKSGAARLLEIKQMLFELQERVDEEKATFTENVGTKSLLFLPLAWFAAL